MEGYDVQPLQRGPKPVCERDIEQALVDAVESEGGICWKWVSPGRVGVPDRIVVLRGRVVFVELKAPGEKLRPEQERRHADLRRAGADVITIDTLGAACSIGDWL